MTRGNFYSTCMHRILLATEASYHYNATWNSIRMEWKFATSVISWILPITSPSFPFRLRISLTSLIKFVRARQIIGRIIWFAWQIYSRLCIRCDAVHTHNALFLSCSRRKLHYNNLCDINDFVSHCTGQQEYSSRQAGVTTGIILGCLVPILLVLICVGHKVLRNRRVERENEEVLARYQIRFSPPKGSPKKYQS